MTRKDCDWLTMHKRVQESGDGSHILPQEQAERTRTKSSLVWENGRLYAGALWFNGPIKPTRSEK